MNAAGGILSTLRRRTVRELRAAGHYLSRLGHKGVTGHGAAIFVAGCQRSGTTMLLDVFGQSPEYRVHQESDKTIYDERYRLRSHDVVLKAVRDDQRPFVVIKPLNDLQDLGTLLDLCEGSRAVWIYRRYRDVARSAVRKWGDAQREIICGISEGTLRHPGQEAVGGRLSPVTYAIIREACRGRMTPHDGAALLWYVQNSRYFSLKLQDDHRVMMVRYEDLVTLPEVHFRRVFGFVGSGWSPEYIRHIHHPSANSTGLTLRADIELLCEEMTGRLDRCHAARLARQQAPEPRQA